MDTILHQLERRLVNSIVFGIQKKKTEISTTGQCNLVLWRPKNSKESCLCVCLSYISNGIRARMSGNITVWGWLQMDWVLSLWIASINSQQHSLRLMLWYKSLSSVCVCVISALCCFGMLWHPKALQKTLSKPVSFRGSNDSCNGAVNLLMVIQGTYHDTYFQELTWSKPCQSYPSKN